MSETRSVYVIGGAGAGKSTFMERLIGDRMILMGPLEDLHSAPNSRGTIITLRGHRFPDDGVYLGLMRDNFPGTDGLDRVSSVAGVPWLRLGMAPAWVIGEGATLANRPFLTALSEETDLLLIHLRCDDAVKVARFQERGSSQDPKFVAATVTKSANLLNEMTKAGVKTIDADTNDYRDWDFALDAAAGHLWGPR